MVELGSVIVAELTRMTPSELVGACTGIAGALLLAWRGRFAGWAWVLWIISSMAWVIYAVTIWSIPLMAQQTVFTAINLLGAYRWLIQKKQ